MKVRSILEEINKDENLERYIKLCNKLFKQVEELEKEIDEFYKKIY